MTTPLPNPWIDPTQFEQDAFDAHMLAELGEQVAHVARQRDQRERDDPLPLFLRDEFKPIVAAIARRV